MTSAWHERNETLFTDARRGDAGAVDALLEQYLPRLRAYVHLRIPDGIRPLEGTEDVAQSVCRILLGEAERFELRSEAEFRGWLFTTALNKIREKHRFHTRKQRNRNRDVEVGETLARCLQTDSTPSMHAIAHERAERLRVAIEGLPDDYRDVVLKTYVVGMARGAIAEQLGRSEGAVRMLLGRALAQLGDLVDPT